MFIAFLEGLLDGDWNRPARLSVRDVVGRGAVSISVGVLWVTLVLFGPWLAFGSALGQGDAAPPGLLAAVQILVVAAAALRLWSVAAWPQLAVVLILLGTAVLYVLDRGSDAALIAGYLGATAVVQVVAPEIRVRDVRHRRRPRQVREEPAA